MVFMSVSTETEFPRVLLPLASSDWKANPDWSESIMEVKSMGPPVLRARQLITLPAPKLPVN